MHPEGTPIDSPTENDKLKEKPASKSDQVRGTQSWGIFGKSSEQRKNGLNFIAPDLSVYNEHTRVISRSRVYLHRDEDHETVYFCLNLQFLHSKFSYACVSLAARGREDLSTPGRERGTHLSAHQRE